MESITLPRSTKIQNGSLWVTSILLFVEWFDFSAFFFLLSILSNVVFAHPASSNMFYLLLVFSIGTFSRPVGGLLFGYIGDRYSRRRSFLASTLLLIAASALFALLPTYQTIGSLSLGVLLVSRVAQALAMGGYANTLVLISSILPQKKLALGIGFINFTGSLGIAIAAMMTHYMTRAFSEQKLIAFGWRLIPGLSVLLLIFCLGLFPFIHQETVQNKPKTLKDMLWNPLKQHGLLHLRIMSFSAFQSSLYIVAIVLIPVYLKQTQIVSAIEITGLQMLGTIGYMFGTLLTAPIYRKGWHNQYILPISVLMIFAALLQWTFCSTMFVKVSYFILTFVIGTGATAVFLSLAVSFPGDVRSSNSSMAHTFSLAFCQSLCPLITHFLYNTYSIPLITFPLMLGVIVIALCLIQRHGSVKPESEYSCPS